MEFKILGQLEVSGNGNTVAPAAAKERNLLTLLLLRANRVVSSNQLIEELWTGDPPNSSSAGLRVLVSRLRKFLEVLGGGERILTRANGYQLVVEPGELDAQQFELRAAEGRALLDAGDPAGAAAVLRDADALWRGNALLEVVDVPIARAEATRLEEARLAVIEDRIDAELAIGLHDRLVAELDALTTINPLRERLWAARMLALYRSGRQADALRVCQDLRRHLADELGITPSPELVALESAILDHDVSLAGPDQASAVSRPSGVVTFLLSDIEHSSELWEKHRSAMAKVLARHDELVSSIVSERGGTLIKSRGEGDSTFSVFPRATDAALAALELQRALESETWPEDIVLGVRMALHTGEAEERTGDYFGSTVNRASRLRGLADAGQILLSGSTADVIADHLEDAVLIELGERTLRGLERKERVFELCDENPVSDGTGCHRLRVMLVDDHPIWRQAVKVLVERDGAAVVVAEADDGEAATAIASDVQPDLVLMDLHLPGIGGIEATRRITQSLPDARVLILSASEEDADVITALRAGALGYVLKSGSGQEVVDAVRRVIAGETVFSAAVSPTVLAELRRK